MASIASVVFLKNLGTYCMTTRPNALKIILSDLARAKQFPNGSARHGYEIVAPLDQSGHIDSGAWKEHRAQCRVKRSSARMLRKRNYMLKSINQDREDRTGCCDFCCACCFPFGQRRVADRPDISITRPIRSGAAMSPITPLISSSSIMQGHI